MKLKVALTAIAVGILLVALSLFWVNMFPGTATWTLEKDQQWAKVKERLHNLSFIVNRPPGSAPLRRHPDMAAVKAEYDQVKQRHQELKAEFESAYNSPRTTATALKWSGVTLAVLGVGGWLVVRNDDE